MRSERGFALTGIAILLAAITLAFVAGEMSVLASSVASQDAARREEYLDAAARAVAGWYERNAAAIDARAELPVSEDAIPEEAGIGRRWGLRSAASARLAAGDLAFRRIVLWLPASNPDPSAWNAATGTFSPGPGVRWRLVNGQEIQGRSLRETVQTMQELAAKLEERFHAKVVLDGSGSVGVNYFRPRNGCAAAMDEIPCLDAYADAATVDWARIIGAPIPGLRTAWGGPILVSNLQDSSASFPPFSMAIAADAPWGTRVRVIAIQPM